MKTSHRLFQMLVVALIFNVTNLFAQDLYYITIHVETDKISNQNKLGVCYFTSEAPNGDITTSTGNIEDFNIEVKPSDIIIWRGVSSTNPEGDMVNIRSINHQGGQNVFDRNILHGNGQTPEVVIGEVNPGTQGRIQKYAIKITVYNEDRKRGNYRIDPKITVKP
ncbi:hypothetical protein [Winogradskyella arenosi]|uniref:Uncharacterized protein n=1 Tax=Winogradskyella arenosi TaxID=533325 RepID=A0A368ZL19_9FLAO|nr:hypothetical protein [Winogradskyella arenosi]RCW93266.1 hypothetical protein DFQ08_10157 [Winogradskyella arenosi]